MKYDVSVIIPFFNNEDYLEEAIDSIMVEQNKKIKYEVILINDCSTDKSLEVIKKYLNYNNVTLINKKNNEGVSAARNEGIRKARGKYIMLLDGDDFVSNNSISNLFYFFEKHNSEIDLVTYPLYLKTSEKEPKINSKYEIYDKGTGVYSLEEYSYINQTTINVMFKNDKKIFFDEKMKLAEDQKFVTNIIMKKQKIGYCEEAQYIYRRHGGGTSQVYNNFYYCYDDIMKYNNWLITTYKKGKKIPKYIQGMILNTLCWRLKNDMLFPYHLEGENYQNAEKEIFAFLEYIDNEYIYNYPKATLSNKIYLLKQKGSCLKLQTKGKSIDFVSDNTVLDNFKQFNLKVKRNKISKNKVCFRAVLEEPVWDITKPKVYLIIKKQSKLERKELNLFESSMSKNKSRVKINNIYYLDFYIDLQNVEYFYFELELQNTNFVLTCSHEKFSSGKKISKNYIINYRKKYSKYFVKKANMKNKVIYLGKSIIKEFNKSLKLQLFKLFSIILNNKIIWLYNDTEILDNAYFQFVHDINKKDGIKRYYICTKKIKETIGEKYYNNIVISNSKKHKWLFLNASRIITSNPAFESYSPYKKNNKIKDVLNYKLIYLPETIIHVDSSKFYNKENNEVDKLIVSSNFEEINLIKNYGYSSEDLIRSITAKYELINKNKKAKNKILFTISSRSYLFFKNKTNMAFFEKSTFYKNINNFINNTKFLNLLEEYNINFDIKIDEDLLEYSECFKLQNDRIKIKTSQIDLSEYNLLITDFSPIQFEFAKFIRPIVYFIPDINEFKAGLHLFRKIDLSEKENFGITCSTDIELIKQIEVFCRKNFSTQEKYKIRMESFFLNITKCREKVYNSIKQMENGE